MQIILDYKFPLNPKYMLLGIFPPNISRQLWDFFFYATMSARHLLASKWKQQEIPEVEDWIDKLRAYAATARLTNFLTQRPSEDFASSWDPFLNYLNS